MRLWVLAAAGALCLPAFGELTAEQRKLNAESFDYVWKTVRDKHWSMPAGVDWEKAKSDLRPKAANAQSMAEARGAIGELLGRLGQTHFGIVPADVYESLGDALQPGKGGEGQPGFDLRILGNEAVVVSVEPGSPAEQAGVRPGWAVRKAAGAEVAPLLEKASAAVHEPGLRGLILARTVLARLSGAVGSEAEVVFADGKYAAVEKRIRLIAPKGDPAKLGYLPNQHVWIETSQKDNIGYARWNMFMDPPRIMSRFGDAVQSCEKCDGFVIDLRGNPGGIGGMAMGMAGWFIAEPDKKLGVMKTRDAEAKFVVIPRANVFTGPLAIVVDDLTGSTSEILSGGLKDLGRARVFGSRTAGAALPSVFEKLPNGDGFQYAVANYISQGGQPLEGAGVTPDAPVTLTREALLAGRDPALDAAFEWIKSQRKDK